MRFSTEKRPAPIATLTMRRFVILFCCLCTALAARAAVDLSTATIAELEAAMARGALTSEKLTQLYLDRIATYDKQGPTINAVIVLNPKALATARALDAERKAGKIRSPI